MRPFHINMLKGANECNVSKSYPSVRHWIPIPLKITPQNTLFFCENFSNFNYKPIIDFFHLNIIPMSCSFIKVNTWSSVYCDFPWKIRWPKKFTIANLIDFFHLNIVPMSCSFIKVNTWSSVYCDFPWKIRWPKKFLIANFGPLDSGEDTGMWYVYPNL